MAAVCNYKLAVVYFVMAAQASFVLTSTKLWTYLAKRQKLESHVATTK